MKKLVLLSAFALLAACSERDLCEGRATAELDAAKRQISELQQNIARGYAVHKSYERIPVKSVCYRKNGKPYECMEMETELVEKPVALDIGDQRRQLRDIRARLPKLEEAAKAGIRQCRRQYPE